MDIQEINIYPLATGKAYYEEGTVLGPEDGVKSKPPPHSVTPECI